VALAGRCDCLNVRIVSGEFLESMDRRKIND
jgi:hypothetical protein